MPLAEDGTFEERRKSTPIGSTAGVPSGTMVTVPASLPTGSTPAAPVVAVNTKPWYQSVTLWLAAVGLPVLDILAEEIPKRFDLNTSGANHVLVTVIGLYLAWRRYSKNTVIR